MADNDGSVSAQHRIDGLLQKEAAEAEEGDTVSNSAEQAALAAAKTNAKG